MKVCVLVTKESLMEIIKRSSEVSDKANVLSPTKLACEYAAVVHEGIHEGIHAFIVLNKVTVTGS